MSNQADFYPLFDLIIMPTINAEALRKRPEDRTHTYGNNPANIEQA